MNYRSLLLLLGSFYTSLTVAQIPFITTMKENYKYYIKADPSNDYGIDFLRSSVVSDAATREHSKTISLDSVGVSLFRNNSLGGDIIGDKAIMRISSSIVYYKLYIYEKEADNVRYYLPLFLISRFASQYDSANVTSAIDALAYEGSPITIRFMPSGKLKVGDSNHLFYGVIADYRGLNIVKSPGDNTYEQGFYLSAGVTYGGRGTGEKLGSGEVTNGVWSVSLLGELFTASDRVISEMYNTDKSYIASAQVLFNFFAGKDNPLNIKAGAQYFFSDPLNAEKFSLKLALGSN